MKNKKLLNAFLITEIIAIPVAIICDIIYIKTGSTLFKYAYVFLHRLGFLALGCYGILVLKNKYSEKENDSSESRGKTDNGSA